MKLKNLLLIAALCLGLAACGSSGDSGAGGAGGGDAAPNAFTNSETGVSITLGMTRDEVGELITPKVDATWVEDEWGQGSMFYGETPEESLAIIYQDNKVIGIGVGEHINTAETSQWSINGVTKGSSLEDIIAAYGENEAANAEGQIFNYVLDDGAGVGFFVGENGLYSYALTAGAAESETPEDTTEPAEGEAEAAE